jgi:hypothetical protein
MLILVEIGAFMLVASLLNLLNHFISYLSSWLLTSYLLIVSLWGLTLVFVSLGTTVEYSCLNTLIFISYIASHTSLNLCMMSSLPKGGENMDKVGRTLLLNGWLREGTR